MKSFPLYFKHHRSWQAAISLLIAVAISLWSLPATAAGFFLPTRGVEATARGGASVAPHRPSLDTIWHNPAGLSLIEDLQLTIDAALISMSVEHQRAPRHMDDGSTRHYEPVQNEAPPNIIPQILIGGPTPHPDISWAFGAYTHYASTGRYPVDGPQRYVLVDTVGTAMGYLHAAVGWQITDRLALGAGIQNFMGELRVVSVGSGYTGLFGDPEDEDLDILGVATISSNLGLTGNMGATFQIHDRLQSGLSLQLGHEFHDPSATLQTRMPDHPAYDNAEPTGDEIDIAIPLPFFLRGALRYVGESFDLELALLYHHWSVFDEIVATPQDVDIEGSPGIDSIPVPPLVIPRNLRNTFSAHIGGEYTLSSSVDIRSGYVYERGAIPDTHYNLLVLDPNKHQLSAGASYHVGSHHSEAHRFSIDFTTAAIIMPSKHITNSEIRQVNPSDPDDEQNLVVANGTYEHFGFIVGLALRSRF